MKKIILALFGLLICSQAYCSENKLGITLGNPWLGVKYNLSSRFGSEVRYVIDPDMSIASVRGNYNFLVRNKVKIFAGLEYGVISFKYDGITGSGNSFAPFIGGEYALGEKLGLGMDFGYSTISLSSGGTSVSGPEYVFNLYVSYFVL